jgi:hypothetical protein
MHAPRPEAKLSSLPSAIPRPASSPANPARSAWNSCASAWLPHADRIECRLADAATLTEDADFDLVLPTSPAAEPARWAATLKSVTASA